MCLTLRIHFLQAHQAILSACSPFFQKIFIEHQSPKPVIILDFNAEDVRAMLEFVYLGEVNVPQSSYNEFITAAKKLQVSLSGLLNGILLGVSVKV